MRVFTMDRNSVREKDETKEERQYHEEDCGKRHDGTPVCARSNRNNITDHVEVQSKHSNEGSQHHQKVTGKTRQSGTT